MNETAWDILLQDVRKASMSLIFHLIWLNFITAGRLFETDPRSLFLNPLATSIAY